MGRFKVNYISAGRSFITRFIQSCTSELCHFIIFIVWVFGATRHSVTSDAANRIGTSCVVMATEQLAQGQHVFCAPISVEREWHLFCLGSYFSQVVFGKTNAAFVFKRLNFRSNSKQLCNSTGRLLRRLQVISHLSNKTIDTKVLQCFNWMLASFSGHRSSLASPRGGGANCKPL